MPEGSERPPGPSREWVNAVRSGGNSPGRGSGALQKTGFVLFCFFLFKFQCLESFPEHFR